MERSMGRFAYQCGQIGRQGAARRQEGRLRRASGRPVGETEREGEICHLLSVPPAPLSCILPDGRGWTLMSEGEGEKDEQGVGVDESK